MVAVWSMLLFTEYVPEPVQRYEFAFPWLYMLAVDVALNVLVLIFVLVRKIYTAIRNAFKKRKAKN